MILLRADDSGGGGGGGEQNLGREEDKDKDKDEDKDEEEEEEEEEEKKVLPPPPPSALAAGISSLTTQMMMNPPCATLYVSNLNTKLRPHILSQHLYSLFTAVGRIVSISTSRGPLRGQAFVSCRDATSAANVLSRLNGVPFFDQPLRICFAAAKSDAVAHLDGDFDPSCRVKRLTRRAAKVHGTSGAGPTDDDAAGDVLLEDDVSDAVGEPSA